jgi:hypothetical protein
MEEARARLQAIVRIDQLNEQLHLIDQEIREWAELEERRGFLTEDEQQMRLQTYRDRASIIRELDDIEGDETDEEEDYVEEYDDEQSTRGRTIKTHMSWPTMSMRLRRS